MQLRETYARVGIEQIPRLLSLMDRNPFSKTYGCMDRTYWLDKAIDFPSSIAQFGVHAFALVYSYEMPGNIYYKNKNILEWCKAGINYWIKIQKNDGSFDEFYPNERGWAGPTGFLLYSMLASYELLKEYFDDSFQKNFLQCCKKAAFYLAKNEEIGVLSNHHAMALLPIYYYYYVTKDSSVLYNFDEKWKRFLSFQSNEGWFLEYDGADPGYLSATISFLGKLYNLLPQNDKRRDEILSVVGKAISFSSYFVYPNGYYAGTIGSRQTLHFYSHGYEIFSKQIPLAGAIAEKMLLSFSQGKLVPPSIMPDRYVVYRVPEMLLSYLDYQQKDNSKILLPYESSSDFEIFFSEAKIVVVKRKKYYSVINLAKGGVIKVFSLEKKGQLIYNSCGFIGETVDGKILTTQWIGKNYDFNFVSNKKVVSCKVSGKMFAVNSLLPTPFKNLLLRIFLLTFGQSTVISNYIKGLIRHLIILKNKEEEVDFTSNFEFYGSKIIITHTIKINSNLKFKLLQIGGEFSVRYVPQSLYFQAQELTINADQINKEQIEELNSNKTLGFIKNLEF